MVANAAKEKAIADEGKAVECLSPAYHNVFTSPGSGLFWTFGGHTL
jgi:hypothetical protein